MQLVAHVEGERVDQVAAYEAVLAGRKYTMHVSEDRERDAPKEDNVDCKKRVDDDVRDVDERNNLL